MLKETSKYLLLRQCMTTTNQLLINGCPSTNPANYSSLLGLLIAPQVTAVNASYDLDTFYMTLVCGDTIIIRNMTEPTIEVPPGWSKGANDFQFQISAEADERNGKPRGRSRQVSLQSHSATRLGHNEVQFVDILCQAQHVVRSKSKLSNSDTSIASGT